MAFGRSNSLSINTGVANSSPFGQQNAAQATPSTGLFGTPAAKPGGLFGNTAAQTTPTAGNTTGTPSLFGSNNTQQPQAQQSGGLFGNTLGQNTQNQPQNQTQGQAGTTATGLFGQTPAQQPAQSSGLFGNLAQNQSQQQKPAGSLFGGFGGQQASQPAQAQTSGGLFGNLGQNKPAGTSLFGNATQQQQQPQQQQPPSLLAASMFNNTSTAAPFAGSLTMGQGNSASGVQPGVKIDLSNIRPTTRFSDLHDDIKAKIEEIDKFIKQQESYAAQCEALLPSHSNNIATIPPDVSVIESKAETVELGLENDGRLISAAKETLKTDVADLTRCVRVIENQSLPSRFHYGPSPAAAAAASAVDGEDYDVDLPGYFSRQADNMASARDGFAANLADIEAHLSVVERRTATMIGEVGRDRASGLASGGTPANDAVRELADTLRGFEGGILDAARRVGGCREGMEDLIAGRRR